VLHSVDFGNIGAPQHLRRQFGSSTALMLVVLVLHSINFGIIGAGHGYDNNQCAEFCITSHHFTVNGQEHMLNFAEAGKPWGCANKVGCNAHDAVF